MKKPIYQLIETIMYVCIALNVVMITMLIIALLDTYI